MSIIEYESRFSELSYYASILIPTEVEKVRWLIKGLSYGIKIYMAREEETRTTFHQAVEITFRIK